MFDQKRINYSANLTQKQQKILKARSANIDGEKYKKGKFNYMSYIQSRKNENAYRNYLLLLKNLDYMNKMLLISSIKYYRDIKTLLIGNDAKDGANNSNQEIQSAIIKIDNIVQGRSDGQFEKLSELQKNTKVNSKNQTMTATKQTVPDNTRELKTEQKVQKFARQSKVTKSNQTTFSELKQIQKPQQKRPNKLEKQQVVTKVQEGQTQKFEKIDASQYKFLKLIEVESKLTKEKPGGAKTNRTNNKLTVSTTTKNANERPASVRSFGKQTKLITDLSSNQLYQKHRTTFEKYQPKTSEKQNKKQLPTTLKKMGSHVDKPNVVKKSSSIRREEESLCDKLLSCLKSLFTPRPQPPRVSSKSEQGESLLKKKASGQIIKSGTMKKNG